MKSTSRPAHIVVGDQITGDHLERCDCAVAITMTPPIITLYGHVAYLIPPCPPTKATDPERNEDTQLIEKMINHHNYIKSCRMIL
jgi:hypothetical protein